MWDSIRDWPPAASRSSSPRSTSTRPTSSPIESRSSTTAASSPREPPTELKRRIPGGHVQLQFDDAGALQSAAAPSLDGVPPDRRRDKLVLQVPSDGSVASLRAAARAARRRATSTVAQVSIHTPDLDDVFFAFTGRPSHETEAAAA